MSGSLILINSAEITTSVTEVDLTGIDSTYDVYMVIYANLTQVNDNSNINIRFLDSGGSDDTGLIYEDNGKKVKHIFSDGSLNIMQPKFNYHKGWNANKKERVNLVIDFYNGKYANEMDLKKYFKEYNEVFYGLDNMHDFYEAKKIFGSQYTQTYAQFLEGDLKYAT